MAADAAARIFNALEDLGMQLLKDDEDDGVFLSNSVKYFWSWPSTGSSVIHGIHQINKDWSFLSTLCESIQQFWMDAGGGGGEESILKMLKQKIEAAAEEIAQYAEEKKQIMHHQFRLSEFLELVSYFQSETKLLMVEIREAVEDLSAGCTFQFQVHSPPLPHPPPDDKSFSFWTSFVDSVLWNLRFISDVDSSVVGAQVYALYKELKSIRDFIVGVCSDIPAAGDDGDDVDIAIDDFLNHVAFVIVRTAIQSSNYWFHYKTATTTDPGNQEGQKIKLATNTMFMELQQEIDPTNTMFMELQQEIDPTNPKFMELHFHFLVIVSRIGRYQGKKFVNHFCKYFFKSREGDVRNEVSSLLTCFLDSILHDEEEEVVQSFCQEINAVLLWMASLFEAVRKKDVEEEVYLPIPPCSELLVEICLLKAELFLKKLLHHNLSSNTFSTTSADKNQTEDEFDQIIKNLRIYSKDLPYAKIEYRRKALAVIEQVPYEVASLCQSFEAKKISETVLKNSILRLLLKIVIFRAESFLGESLLFKSNDVETSVMDDEDQITLLLEQVSFLKPILSSEQVKEKEDSHVIFAQVEALLREITCFSYSNLTNKKITQDMIKEMIPSSELLDKVKHLKPMLFEIAPQFPLFKFPKTHRLGFINFLFTNLGEMLEYDPESIAPLKHYVEEIQLHLKSLSSLLIKLSDSDIHQHPELKDLDNRVIDLAYKFEYVIDSIEDDAQWQHFSWFYILLEELRLVNKQASGIHLTTSDAIVQSVNNVTQLSLNMIPQGGKLAAINEIVVDLNDQEQVIIDQLTRGSSQRNIVSIIGMPGIGKTTLARKVYNNQNVMYYFHRHAWCYVSQVYEKRELLVGILGDIHGLTDQIHQMSNEDLESKLRQCLLKNKYLIVMDDVWDAGAWNDLKNSFPDEVNGSRILITSRLRDVALEIEPNGDPHSLRPFSDDESWNLLEGKVFQGEACPQELLVVGKEIAQKCEGLPLAVVAISGLLRRTEKNKESWQNISESLSSEIMKDREVRCIEILDLSYKHLPEYLKACFLYLGVFLEDKDIPVSKLIRFWLAEGFIEKIESQRLEDIAEDYLEDLINRSLVIISKRRSNGKVKACRLHDLVIDFCRSKAKDENFLQLVTRCDKPYASFPSSDYGFEFDFYHHLEPVPYDAYRLSILLKRNHFVESRPSGLGTRTLIFFGSADSEPRCPYDISFICHNFKLLRVLDFECINIGVSFPVEIELLVLLRYLAVSGYMHYVPQSIQNLSNLETLVVKGLRGKVVLPDTIWYMTRLRHLHVNIHVAFGLDDGELGDLFELENLVSFSCPSLSCGEDTEKMMKRLPNLRKLKCVFFESRDSSKNSDQFPRLNFLTQLESLNIFYYGSPLDTSEFNLPLNLRELSLSNFRLPWDHISVIGRLPNLTVLKLRSGAFDGRRWDMREEEFLELKFLKLENLNISQWNASCDHLPKLERLVLQNCKDLEKIPQDFADITTLEMIEVHWCGQSAENSAKEIGEATGEIKVLISSI